LPHAILILKLKTGARTRTARSLCPLISCPRFSKERRSSVGSDCCFSGHWTSWMMLCIARAAAIQLFSTHKTHTQCASSVALTFADSARSLGMLYIFEFILQKIFSSASLFYFNFTRENAARPKRRNCKSNSSHLKSSRKIC
jgi:hypothetical protein